MLDQMLPDMLPHIAQQLRDRGSWSDGESGAILTEPAQRVGNMPHLVQGKAQVWASGPIECGLVGEMNVRAGGDASATVRIVSPSRPFMLLRNGTRLNAAHKSFRAQVSGQADQS